MSTSTSASGSQSTAVQPERPPHDPNQTVMTRVTRTTYGEPTDILHVEHDVQVPSSPGPGAPLFLFFFRRFLDFQLVAFGL